MDAPLLIALARAKLAAGCNAVENVRAGRTCLGLSWVPDRREAFPNHGWTWVFVLAPQPELWLLHDKDEAWQHLKSRTQADQTRRWGVELRGARLVEVEGDPRERWLGLCFERRALSGRVEHSRLAFQAIPGRGGLRLDGTDPLTQVRLGAGSPFPAEAPAPEGDTPPLLRWQERWGDCLAEAIQGRVPGILPGDGSLLDRHRAWSLGRAQRLLLEPVEARKERLRRQEAQRLERYGEALARDRERHRSAVALKEPAVLLSAELYRLKGACGSVGLLDGRRLELPAGLNAEGAVQAWFRAAKRGERGLDRVEMLEADRQRQLAALGAGVEEAGGRRPERIKEGRPMDEARAERRSDGKGRAFRSVMVEGFEVLIGKGDADNDALTFKVADAWDYWLHVAGVPGSHVVIRNPDRLGDLPREVLERAAQLAAFHSKAREGGKVEVHWCRVADISKPRGFAPGKVLLRSYKSVRVYPRE